MVLPPLNETKSYLSDHNDLIDPMTPKSTRNLTGPARGKENTQKDSQFEHTVDTSNSYLLGVANKHSLVVKYICTFNTL